MKQTKDNYYYTYRKFLRKEYSHIIYYENRFDAKNKCVMHIMKKMRLKYPKVPCTSFHWRKRNITGFNIFIENSNEILCFRDRKQICKVDAFNELELESLFRTVFNDLLENYSTVFRCILYNKKLLKDDENLIKYNIENPSYNIMNKPKPNMSMNKSTIEGNSQSYNALGDSEHKTLKLTASNEAFKDYFQKRMKNRYSEIKKAKTKLSKSNSTVSSSQILNNSLSRSPPIHFNQNNIIQQNDNKKLSIIQNNISIYQNPISIQNYNQSTYYNPDNLLNPNTFVPQTYHNIPTSYLPTVYNPIQNNIPSHFYYSLVPEILPIPKMYVLTTISQPLAYEPYPINQPPICLNYNSEFSNPISYIQTNNSEIKSNFQTSMMPPHE